MKKAMQICLLIFAVALAAIMMMDSFSVVQTGIGNGAVIEWDDSFADFCDELAEPCQSDGEKVRVFRNWVIDNITYDYDSDILFYQTFRVDKVMQSRKGVCFDFACLFAAMCRSQGIPCYVLEGTYKTDKSFRHAWNRVYFDGQWWSLDTTRDSTARDTGEEEYSILPIGSDPFSADEYFTVHRYF